jgi:hypothetical protein
MGQDLARDALTADSLGSQPESVEIEEELARVERDSSLSLKWNAESMSGAASSTSIKGCVSWKKETQGAVRLYMSQNANGTFLCPDLDNIPG